MSCSAETFAEVLSALRHAAYDLPAATVVAQGGTELRGAPLHVRRRDRMSAGQSFSPSSMAAKGQVGASSRYVTTTGPAPTADVGNEGSRVADRRTSDFP